MPGSYNRVILVGNLTRDPEMRYIASGAGVVKFALAVNRRTKTGDETTYIDIVAWDKLAETCNTYLKKGMSVLVEGRLVIRSFDDKDGAKRKATEVVIDVMQMLDRRGEGGGGGGSYNGGGSSYGDGEGGGSGGGRSYGGDRGGNGGGDNGDSGRSYGSSGSKGGSSANGGGFDDSALEDEIPF